MQPILCCEIHYYRWNVQLLVYWLWFTFLFHFLPLGIFIYPLEENSIVVGFEAMISSQIITLQIKDKAKIEDCYQDCCSTSNGTMQSGSGKINVAPINNFISVTVMISVTNTILDYYDGSE